jgi:hypothetical protein
MPRRHSLDTASTQPRRSLDGGLDAASMPRRQGSVLFLMLRSTVRELVKPCDTPRYFAIPCEIQCEAMYAKACDTSRNPAKPRDTTVILPRNRRETSAKPRETSAKPRDITRETGAKPRDIAAKPARNRAKPPRNHRETIQFVRYTPATLEILLPEVRGVETCVS